MMSSAGVPELPGPSCSGSCLSMACPSPESLMQSCTKLSYLKKVVRKDRMLLLTGAEVLQSFQRQVVVIMRNNWLPLFLFPTFVGSPRYQILHLPHANFPSSSDCEVELPEVQWDTATTFAGGKRRGYFGPLCLLVQLGFWYTFFAEKEKKVYFHFVHIFLCAVPILFFRQKLL